MARKGISEITNTRQFGRLAEGTLLRIPFGQIMFKATRGYKIQAIAVYTGLSIKEINDVIECCFRFGSTQKDYDTYKKEVNILKEFWDKEFPNRPEPEPIRTTCTIIKNGLLEEESLLFYYPNKYSSLLTIYMPNIYFICCVKRDKKSIWHTNRRLYFVELGYCIKGNETIFFPEKDQEHWWPVTSITMKDKPLKILKSEDFLHINFDQKKKILSNMSRIFLTK